MIDKMCKSVPMQIYTVSPGSETSSSCGGVKPRAAEGGDEAESSSSRLSNSPTVYAHCHSSWAQTGFSPFLDHQRRHTPPKPMLSTCTHLESNPEPLLVTCVTF